MVHHSCYLNISFEADRLLFFWVLGRLPCPLRGASRRVLLALSQQNPLFLSAARISASLRRTTFRRMRSI